MKLYERDFAAGPITDNERIAWEKADVPFMITTSNTESQRVREGLTQIRDWKRWLDDNRAYFLNSIGLTSLGIEVPTYRIYYYLVVSNREHMGTRETNYRSQLCSFLLLSRLNHALIKRESNFLF